MIDNIKYFDLSVAHFGKDFEVMSVLVLLGKHFVGLSAFDQANILSSSSEFTIFNICIVKAA